MIHLLFVTNKYFTRNGIWIFNGLESIFSMSLIVEFAYAILNRVERRCYWNKKEIISVKCLTRAICKSIVQCLLDTACVACGIALPFCFLVRIFFFFGDKSKSHKFVNPTKVIFRIVNLSEYRSTNKYLVDHSRCNDIETIGNIFCESTTVWNALETFINAQNVHSEGKLG